MKRNIFFIILSLLILASCQQDEMEAGGTGHGTLSLSLVRSGVPQMLTRAVDADLTLEIRKPDGNIYKSYAPGTAPSKIELEANVLYTVRAYTDNQSTWQSANGGLGEGCFWGETTVSVGEDETVYCVYAVPMLNYAVGLTLPPSFSTLFSSYTFSVSSGSRTMTLRDGQKAYLDPSAGFTYQLKATNTDGVANEHAVVSYTEVAAGKFYNVCYGYNNTASVSVVENTEP